MPAFFSRCCFPGFLLVCTCSAIAAAAAQPQQATPAPESLENAKIVIESTTGTKNPYRRVIRTGKLLPVGECSQEFHTELGLPAPALIADGFDDAVIVDLEYGFKQQEGKASAKAYLCFSFKTPGSQDSDISDFDFNAPFDATEDGSDQAFNIHFTHNRRGVYHGTIRGWEAPQNNDGNLTENEYRIQISFGDNSNEETSAISQEFQNQQGQAFLNNQQLNPEFIHWIICRYFEQITANHALIREFEPIYSENVYIQNTKKKRTPQELSAMLMTLQEKFPTRYYAIKSVGVKKNTIQISAEFLFDDNAGYEQHGYKLLSLAINKSGRIHEMQEVTSTRTLVPLSSGFKTFPYKEKAEFYAIE